MAKKTSKIATQKKKILLNPEYELIQRIQTNFPRELISAETIQAWNECPGAFLKESLATFFSQPPVFQKQEKFLTFLFSLDLSETDGSATIADAIDVFEHIDPCFEKLKADLEISNYCATPKMKVDVFESCADGTFIDIFGSFKGNIFVTEAQIITFVKDHRDQFGISENEHATFFACKANEEYFVICVRPESVGKFGIYRLPFKHTYKWHAGFKRHFIVPHQFLI